MRTHALSLLKGLAKIDDHDFANEINFSYRGPNLETLLRSRLINHWLALQFRSRPESEHLVIILEPEAAALYCRKDGFLGAEMHKATCSPSVTRVAVLLTWSRMWLKVSAPADRASCKKFAEGSVGNLCRDMFKAWLAQKDRPRRSG